MVNSRGGTFTPSPAQTIVTGVSHSPHGSHHSTFSAVASPSTNSPVGASGVNKIVVAQVYLLLGTIKEDKDRTKWEQQAEQLRKLVDEHGMEVFSKYFSRLVVGNAPQIFPGINRAVLNSGNYQILVSEVHKVAHDVDQAGKIARSIETGNEDIFRDFDLAIFMDHFKLDALEKTILALAFKTGTRSDLKTKADEILLANYQDFVHILSRVAPGQEDLNTPFLATIVDRFIQGHPPDFEPQEQIKLFHAIRYRFRDHPEDIPAPTEVLAALFLMTIITEANPLILYIQKTGPVFTSDEDACRNYIRHAGDINIDEVQVADALLYTAISRTYIFSPQVFVSSLRKEVPSGFSWLKVVQHFDIPDLRISPQQFLAVYEAIRPLALEDPAIIPQLLGGAWQNTETQLSFISAYASLSPNELDASTIPKLRPSFTLEDYVDAKPEIRERAEWAVRHPLVSVITLTSVFVVALREPQYSETVEAKRLFQEVVVPNLDIFLVSAFGVPRPWPDLAIETINNLFERFLFKVDGNYDFVLASLWRKDKTWVAHRLMEAHVKSPLELPLILEHAVKHEWLYELASMLNGFGLDLAALAHSRGLLDLKDWKAMNSAREEELGAALMTFLNIKAQHELQYQTAREQHSIMLPVKTVLAMLNVLEEILPKEPSTALIAAQRTCITAYPRLINYGQDDEIDRIIDNNGLVTNMLSAEATQTMEQHYKQMYSEERAVRQIVDALAGYKSARDPYQQDVFACMIHGLFDEYGLYHTYPLEALATTAVLFGGIIQDRLIADLPLEIGLGMILEAVRDNSPEQDMYKFGLQALLQFTPRLSEWPGFCHQLLQVPGLEGTEPWKRAQNVIHDQQEDMLQNGHNDSMNGGGITNGNFDEMLSPAEPAAPPFTSINIDPLPPNADFQDPDEDAQDKVLFLLNNITELNIESKFVELKNALGETNKKWFAGHLVEERAKLQPNYHVLYLGLVKLFEDKILWNQLLRETFISVSKLLNAESTLQSSIERSHLKNLGGWLGSMTLANDKPIKHRNIAFKQLLLEAYDTQRLIIVIPFVCKVLFEGRNSVVFKPPNPWLMDIIHLLIELYHNAELKLNLKFEIEVLCKGLNLDHKSIKPSTEFQSRIPPVEEATEPMAVPDGLDRFENLSVNGLGGGIASGRFSPQEILATMPDLGPLLTYPPSNDMVNSRQLHDILKTAITRAVHEIISPVVERSVTIAAISTAQMIHKDFATEPNEARVRSAAINMVKKTAGSLALVTSKEPLRASMTNYIRTLSAEHQLPEGTIIMCVNSNLDLACSQVEKKAEERAVPEIEEMLEPELEARRVHHMRHPGQEYIDPQLSRWALTIPSPYKLTPTPNGLNQEQMAIYDEFARQPRLLPIADRGSVAGSLAGTTHVATASDATRSITNDLLQDQFSAVSSIPTPAEVPTMPLVNNQQAPYSQPSAALSNGRMPNMAMNPQGLPEKVQRLLADLQQTTADIPEQHYMDLPRPHPVIEILDALYGLIIRSQQGQEPYDIWIAEQICGIVFSGSENTLVIECLVHVLENIIRIGGRCAVRVSMIIGQQVGEALLHVPLIIALVKADMIDWTRVDFATSTALAERKEGTLEFFLSLLEQVFLNDRPLALYTDVAKSLEVAFDWISKEPTLEVGQQLKEKLAASALPKSVGRSQDDRLAFRQDQMEYVFEEWIHLFSNPIAPERAALVFISHMYNRQLINDKEDLCLFLRLSIDTSVERFEQQIQMHAFLNDAYVPIDALAKLVSLLVRGYEREGEVKGDKAAFLESVLSVITLVLNHHHVMRGEGFNQKVFTRLLSSILCHLNTFSVDLTETENHQIILTFAEKLIKLQPAYFPGFVYGWMTLISHRFFLVPLMGLPDDMGWQPFAKLAECLLSYIGELLKPLQLSLATRDIYQGVVKFFVVLQHDYPDFLAAHSSKLCAKVPSHCVQLLNLILNAHPTMSKLPDPLQSGLKVDRIEEIRISPEIVNSVDIEGTLQSAGLFEILEQALQNGPSEDAVAHITHTIQRQQAEVTGPGFVPVNVDLQLIESLVLHISMYAVATARQKGDPNNSFNRSSTDAALISMLVHELNPEARHYLLTSMVNQLRFPNAHTNYFVPALLELFGNDPNDQEESDISQQILRVLLERAFISLPIPWGVLLTVIELVKNEKYTFFDLPYIKSTPEVADRIAVIVQRSLSR